MIPVRMAASRLPGKPLLDINGKTLIRRVYENCRAALPGDVVVAAGDATVVEECEKFGARAVLTDPELPSGTDRIAAALKTIDPSGAKYDVVVDFQGDNVNVDPCVNLPLIGMVEKGDCDVATCGMVIRGKSDVENPSYVKICMGPKPGEDEARALYFTRAAAPYIRDPDREGISRDYYWHIGIYVFKASALARAAGLAPGVLENREKLEQLRWLENGMVVRAKIIECMKLVERAPADVNTPEDLEEARKWIR
jgi:3-deoxy-manno-octulosonate cytidylyltransferase (CMP-KDO synthetase)